MYKQAGFPTFLPGEPNDGLGYEDCVAYTTNGMNDVDCTNSYQFLCETPAGRFMLQEAAHWILYYVHSVHNQSLF